MAAIHPKTNIYYQSWGHSLFIWLPPLSLQKYCKQNCHECAKRETRLSSLFNLITAPLLFFDSALIICSSVNRLTTARAPFQCPQQPAVKFESGILAQQWAQMTQREHHGIKSYPRAVVQMMPHPSPQQDMVLLSGSAALTYQCQAAVNCRGQILLYRCLGCQYKDEPGNIIILHTQHRHLFSVKRIVLSSGKLVLFPT